MAFREISVNEIREVLRLWLGTAALPAPGLRKITEHAGVDRKTVRRYVEAAQAADLKKTDSVAAVNDDMIAAVVDTVRPDRPHGHGASWEQLVPHQEQISKWVEGDGEQKPLTIAKIEVLPARKGCVVPYRTLHRFATERCGFGRKNLTVRVVDGDPGIECQVDFRYLGMLTDPDDGRARKVHALIFTAVYSRHMFVWLTYSQTLVGGDCRLRGGVEVLRRSLRGSVSGQPQTRCQRGRPDHSAIQRWLARLQQSCRVHHRSSAGPVAEGQAACGTNGAVRARELLGRGTVHQPLASAGGGGSLMQQHCGYAYPWHDLCTGAGCIRGLRTVGTATGAGGLRRVDFQGRQGPPRLPCRSRTRVVFAAAAVDGIEPVGARGHRTGEVLRPRHPGQDPPPSASWWPQHRPRRSPRTQADYALRDVTSLIAKCTSTGPNFGIYAERILDDPLPWTRIRSVYRLQGLVRRYGAERVDQACSLSLDLDVVSVTKIASMLGAPPNPPRRINRKRSDNLRLDSPATQPNSVLLQSHLFPS